MILADTSGLLCLLDEGEERHREVSTRLSADRGPLLTIDLVLAETDFLVHRRLGAPAARDFHKQVRAGAVQREPVTADDFERALAIRRAFVDQAFGLTDSSLMAVAERLRVPVLTLDRRHFGVFRDHRGQALDLLP